MTTDGVAITDAKLEFPLTVQWVWKSPQPPQTAWTGPAKWDAYSGNSGLQSMRNFDPCFYVTVSERQWFSLDHQRMTRRTRSTREPAKSDGSISPEPPFAYRQPSPMVASCSVRTMAMFIAVTKPADN